MLAQSPALNPSDLLGPFLTGALIGLKAIFVPLALVLAAVIALRIYRHRRLAAAGMPEIERMTGREFEEKLHLLLQARGYRVWLSPHVGDWGADLVAERDGRRRVVQAKLRRNRKVNPTAIQEVVASKAKYGCDEAMVITNADYTRAARELARVNQVELWDRSRLAAELLALKTSIAPLSAPQAVRGRTPPWADEISAAHSVRSVPKRGDVPKCYKCGRPMALKENARGKLWACTGFPACRNTFPVRSGAK